MKKFSKTNVSVIFFLFCLAGIAFADGEITLSEKNTFADHLQYVGVAVSETNHHVWGCSPIKDDEGTYHLFGSRFTGSFLPGWFTTCEIAHYVSKTPEGPFKFVDVVWKGSGDKEAWDTGGLHNPVIAKVDDRYALFAIARSQKETGRKKKPGKKDSKKSNQTIGLMTSDSLYGPWKKEGQNGQILTPSDDPDHWTYKSNNGVNNPAFVKMPSGKYHLYYKSNGMKMGLAIADQLEGPYVHHPESVTRNDKVIEDSYAFRWNDKIYLLTTDNHGTIEAGGGLLWESEDGINFGEPTRGFYPLDQMLKREDYPNAKMVYGRKFWKFERPQLLMEDGLPAWLYVPSGVNIHGREFTDCHVVKILSDDELKAK